MHISTAQKRTLRDFTGLRRAVDWTQDSIRRTANRWIPVLLRGAPPHITGTALLSSEVQLPAPLKFVDGPPGWRENHVWLRVEVALIHLPR
jgi:hypothetical protein